MSLINEAVPFYSPPHRWLRKSQKKTKSQRNHSPPHRWLRKLPLPPNLTDGDSPPHRWLRNNGQIF
ncbi:hypothetical protein BAZOLSSOX_245 [uncultured Gammaproteobacteria bacterium]|nr:hypothetical protein BAZOLSSOX_245 [uncultured Gammaproteobacteria bacterium]